MKQEPLSILSQQGNYSVSFSDELEQLLPEMLELPNSLIVIDENVAFKYHDDLGPLLIKRPTLHVTATEDEKTPRGVLKVWEFFQASNATKQTNVVVIGGGITQDLAQFACHNYYRGLKWHFAPTTLLAQSDSCIGAKCGINLGAYKNQLGVFHSPSHVWICTRFLKSLDDTEVRSGYGEIIKLHLTRSQPSFFKDLAKTVSSEGWRNSSLALFIRRSLEVKKSVIEEDEYEKDIRRILNYGHTFGHSLEAITDHAIPHGMAVAWGMDLVNFISMRRGLLSIQDYNEIHEFLADHYHWNLRRPVSAEELIRGTRRDKKVSDGKLNLVLASTIGKLEIVPCAYDQNLTDEVREYLKDHNVISWD